MKKEEFIKVANSLHDAYTDFARCLYSEAYAEGLTEQIYSFIKKNPGSSTDEVLLYLDDLLGNPRPIVRVTDSVQAKLVTT